MIKFFNIKEECDRYNFLQKTLLLFFAQFIFALTFWALTTYTGIRSILWLTPLFLIFVEVPLLCVFFVLIAKRILSILGVFRISMIVSVIVFSFLVIGLVYFPILALIMYVMLLLAPERNSNVF